MGKGLGANEEEIKRGNHKREREKAVKGGRRGMGKGKEDEIVVRRKFERKGRELVSRKEM